ncbi:MAG: tetratricopeptide repeat protein [Meiothermus sp.]|nr:tetratricopeptide repeat protein [Meiothermus sp.]
MKVRLRLLGAPRLEADGAVSDLPLDRPASLGYYLAQRGDWVRRGELAYLYSPEADESLAASNLRKLVYRLRQQGWAEDLEAEPSRLRLQIPSDVRAFRDALERRDWPTALELYTGPFLEGLAFPDLGGYDAWLELERQDLSRAWRTALLEQVGQLEGQSDWAGAERWLRQLHKAEPLDEEGVQALMRVLRAAGRPGQAREVFDRFRRELGAELGAEPLEATRALAESLRIGGAAAHEPPRPAHNLPAAGTRFVGRKRELEALSRQLANPDCRLLTLVGLGGIGKTRLALELATQQIESFADGVWLVPLAGVSGPEMLVSSLASALGLVFSGPSDPQVQLLNYLRGKESLLVLDNFEHLLEGGLLLEELLAQAPKLRLLVTSRVALETPSEWLYDLEGLTYPPQGTDQDLDGFDAVRLFVGRAERLSNRFVLTPVTLEAVAELTRRVQGLPLALELAATWVRGLSVGEILAQLERGFGPLQSDQPGLPERQRSLQAILEYSWRLLSEGEQAVLARLSVFRGGFTLEAAQHVAGAHLGLLLRFINQALVRRDEDGRYDMHELVRQFAAGKLEPSDHAAVLEKFSGYFYEQLQTWGRVFRGEIQPDTVEQCRRELGNLFSALGHLAASGEATRLRSALADFYPVIEILGLFKNGILVLDMVGEALETTQCSDQGLWGALEAVKSYFQIKVGKDEDSKAMAEASMARLEPVGSSVFLGVAQYTTAMYHHFGGALVQAKLWYEKALTTFEAVGGQSERCRVLNRIAVVMKQMERYEESNRYFEQALALSVEIGDLSERGIILNNYGINFESLGQIDKAIEMYEESLRICERVNYQRGRSAALTNLGHIHERRREHKQAKEYYQRSLEIKRVLGEPIPLAISLINLADVQYALGEDEAGHQANWLALNHILEANALMYAARSLWSFCKFFSERDALDSACFLAYFLYASSECEQWVRDEADEFIARHSGGLNTSQLQQIRQQAEGKTYQQIADWVRGAVASLASQPQRRA